VADQSCSTAQRGLRAIPLDAQETGGKKQHPITVLPQRKETATSEKRGHCTAKLIVRKKQLNMHLIFHFYYFVAKQLRGIQV
jgi:hypothetical protein